MFFSCNCDSVTKAGDSVVDDGFLVEKEYLPVREIKAGGTEGRQRTDKSLEFVVGDLYCTGDCKLAKVTTALLFPLKVFCFKFLTGCESLIGSEVYV